VGGVPGKPDGAGWFHGVDDGMRKGGWPSAELNGAGERLYNSRLPTSTNLF
jgi:hypothetical protein